MKKYNKPIIEEEIIELEDIIAASNGSMSDPVDDFDPNQPGDEMIL
ncbi:MAG: hypothetical protein IKR19_03805 [Acholeplasmatales bacterium]|nr:hypothetical protein [Acholeplasmatales bacterium]